MPRKLTADYLYPITSAPIAQGVVVIEDDGTIAAIGTRDDFDTADLEVHRGTLVPGLVNAHCHLELSHMKGKVATGTQLIPFITAVVQQRDAEAEVIAEAIAKADQEMYDGGIVAVGDISNLPSTFEQKQRSALRYYTFVELFDFLQDANAAETYEKARTVYEQLSLPEGHRKSYVPHAPYSVSRELFRIIREANEGRRTVSIHNQETIPENELFVSKQGGFIDFYGAFGIDLSGFEATTATSIHYALRHLDPDDRNLFVHNTLTDAADLAAAHAWSDHTYWCTCPSANLYIENRLPNYRHFIDGNARVCIGTDSLTSNWQLSVLEEMKTIARYQSYVAESDILTWATLNGAQALGMDDTLGSFDTGKMPGVNLLDTLPGELLESEATIHRLV